MIGGGECPRLAGNCTITYRSIRVVVPRRQQKPVRGQRLERFSTAVLGEPENSHEGHCTLVRVCRRQTRPADETHNYASSRGNRTHERSEFSFDSPLGGAHGRPYIYIEYRTKAAFEVKRKSVYIIYRTVKDAWTARICHL